MANAVVTPQIFAKLVLMDLGGALNVCRNMSKEVTPEFGKKSYKVGASVDVRKPYRFTVSKGLKYDPQPLTDQVTPIKVSQVAQVSFDWDSVEKTLSIREARELYSKPAAIALASTINAEAAQYIALNTFNAVGTPGTTPVDEQPYLKAGDLLIEQGLPQDEELNLIVNRKFSSTFVHGVKTLYNPTGAISQQWKQGQMVDSLGYNVHRDQTIYTRTVGPLGGSPLVNVVGGASADGGNNATMNLVTDGWTASAAARVNQGDRFTIAGVYSVHPQTRQSTGDLQQFVCLAAVSSDGSGNATLSIAPAITASGQYQNVNAVAADDAALTMDGAANTVSPQALLLHKNAYAFVCVPLSNPEPGMGALVTTAKDAETGLNISMVRAFDGVNRKEINRFDVLYDFGVLYREMACCIEA
jgi:predicted pyridoxine 5'-phosphate oxidase superfamily flavin-nucleotide-binding protein